MKSIGLTGGIGSGKSTVARVFEAMGYLVYYADIRSKLIMDEDLGVREAVKALLGKDSYTTDGHADRKYIASIVFQDKNKLAGLNAITHPAVAKDYARWMQELPKDYEKGFVLKEAAILFEAGSHKGSDAVLSVYAPRSLRIARVAARDGVSPEAVMDRMRNQWPDSRKLFSSDYLIFNDGQHHILTQVLAATRYFNNRWQ